MSKAELPIKDVLAALDLNAKDAWNELSAEEKKSVSFWLLNRYMSSVKGSREKAELAVFKTNEYYNKNWSAIGTKHPQLQWQLLCMCGNTGKIEYHEWIGTKKNTSKTVKFLEKAYPQMKQDEVELLARILTKEELRSLEEVHNPESN